MNNVITNGYYNNANRNHKSNYFYMQIITSVVKAGGAVSPRRGGAVSWAELLQENGILLVLCTVPMLGLCYVHFRHYYYFHSVLRALDGRPITSFPWLKPVCEPHNRDIISQYTTLKCQQLCHHPTESLFVPTYKR